MEPETVRVQINTSVASLDPIIGFRSALIIDLHDVIEELIEDGTGITHVASSFMAPRSRFLLNPRSFTPDDLSPLLRRRLLNREASFCHSLAEPIASYRLSNRNAAIYQKPFLISVDVKVVREVRLVLSSVSIPLPGASVDLFQRLLEEQTVETVDLGETCSICLENFSGSPSEETSHQNRIIKMPKCLHLFHQNCIFEWLSRHDSCPLCRRVPYEEDQD